MDAFARLFRRTPETSRGQQVAAEEEQREGQKSGSRFPLFTSDPEAPVRQAVSEVGIRAEDYKVTDEGTDGRRDRDAAGRYANATSAMAL